MILANLCYIFHSNKVLLIKKKRGHGKGLWNGIGGKVLKGENVFESLKREVMEEVGIEILSCSELGKINFDDEREFWEVHIFRCDEFKNSARESDEAKPKWFSIHRIPYKQMWPSDYLWFPYIIQKKNFSAFFKIRNRKILEYHITPVLKKEPVR